MILKMLARMPAAAPIVFCMPFFLSGATVNVPKRLPPQPATVAVVKDNSVDINRMVAEAIDSALGPGGIANVVHAGDKVFIKPNLVNATRRATTDWRIVKALVTLIQACNPGKISIGDGSCTNATQLAFDSCGYTAANFPGVTLVDLNNITANPQDTFVLADGLTGKNKRIVAALYEADVLIDVPKMKTHGDAGYTGALKNLGVGIAPFPIWNNPGVNNTKGGIHHDIRREIVDHVLCRVPDFCLMDALIAMEGNGPTSGGTLITMNLVLASRDPVAMDAVCCRIMGIPPHLITHLTLSANENIGTMDMNAITVKGASVASVQHDFIRAQPAAAAPPDEPGTIPYRATTVIRPAPASMTIDGDLGEWRYANVLAADTGYQVKPPQGAWGGPADCSFRASLMYDASNLYLAVTVRDDQMRENEGTGAAITGGECVELYLSTYETQYNTTRGTTYNAQYDHRLGISVAAAPRLWMLSHGKAVTGASAARVESADGYVIEAKIPWSNFANYGYAAYRELGVNLAVDDADASADAVENKTIWGNAADADIETNPLKMGVAYLDPAGGIYSVPSYTLTVAAVNGTVAKNPDRPAYDSNMVVALTPTPNAGYVFGGWSGDAAGSANPLSVRMNANKTITATFTTSPVLTSIAISPASASVNVARTQQFTATACDQYGGALSPQPAFSWTVSGGGTINGSGLFTAGSAAGGPFAVTASSGGKSAGASVTVVAATTTVYQINCGGAAASPFIADKYYSGGTARTVTSGITMSGVVNAAPQAVYQAERYGNATYTLPNLTAGTQYTVRLHFAELYWTAAGKRKFNVQINGGTVLSNFDIYAETGARYKAIVKEFSATADAQGRIAIKYATVTDNAAANGIEIIQPVPNNPPTVAAAPYADPNPVSATASALSALGADDGGEANLTYTWATSGTAPAAVSFSTNGGNTAKNTVATFTKAGSYTFTVTISDAGGLTAASSVTVAVDQTPGAVAVSPATASVTTSAAQQFTATCRDQFGAALTTQPAFAWSVSGGGSIDASGLFIAGAAVGGPYIVTAQSGAISAAASVTVTAPDYPPTVAAAASAAPNPVMGLTTGLSALGDDDGGEANLTYTWATAGTPPASVSFSNNGGNGAKNTVATFSKAGSYTFTVTIRDQGGRTAASSVAVAVNQTPSVVAVSPATASVTTSAAQQFTATCRDQFGAALTPQPAFTWSVSGGGTIDAGGLFTAGAAAGGPFTVAAQSGALGGSGSVTVLAPAPVSGTPGGGAAAAPFGADQYYSGGTARTVTSAITVSGATNPAPQAVYQAERYGNITYTLPNLTAGAQYAVRLHFAETYWTASGKRKFNVQINGTTVLSNFDVYAETGARYKAIVKEFTATADSQGRIVVKYATVTDNATAGGIQIIRR
jgi:uncharacterized repeat protein (TIGR02543 family)